MTIDRELLESLNGGDLVTAYGWQGLCVSGPVGTNSDGSRWMGGYLRLTYSDGQDLPSWTQEEGAHLTVNQRKPRPLYVNHHRSQPVRGDIVSFEHQGEDRTDDYVNIFLPDEMQPNSPWLEARSLLRFTFHEAFGDVPENTRMTFRLLVDGETGQVVQ